MKPLNQANTPRRLASVQNTKGNFAVSQASTLPVIRVNKVELVSGASLCLLVNTSMLPWPGLQDLESCLSASERRQYAAIVPPEERKRRQATRAVLRMVLGQLTGVAAADVGIGKGAYGKPCLAGSRAIGFSLLAFARDAEIGCDIEKKQPLEDIRGMSRVHCTPEEAEAIGALHGRDAEDAFFRHWVRKEAALKAMGTGFRAEPGRSDSWWNCVTYGGRRQMFPANCDNSGLLFCAAGPGLRQNRPGEPSGAAISLRLPTK